MLGILRKPGAAPAPDLAALKDEKAKREAALAEVSGKINVIEEAAKAEREAAEAKERELAASQKKLESCRQTVVFIEKKLDELRAASRQQAEIILAGQLEGVIYFESMLQEIAGWEAELATFKEIENSLPKEIEKLTRSA
jgi:chromosome segregation ATPase